MSASAVVLAFARDIQELAAERRGDEHAGVAIAYGMVERGWVRPTLQGNGEAAFDFLQDAAPGHVIIAETSRSTLYRKRADGTWGVLHDDDSPPVTIEASELAFHAPFLVLVEPEE